MRKAIFAYVDAGGDGLDAPVKEAILLLKEHAARRGTAPKRASKARNPPTRTPARLRRSGM